MDIRSKRKSNPSNTMNLRNSNVKKPVKAAKPKHPIKKEIKKVIPAKTQKEEPPAKELSPRRTARPSPKRNPIPPKPTKIVKPKEVIDEKPKPVLSSKRDSPRRISPVKSEPVEKALPIEVAKVEEHCEDADDGKRRRRSKTEDYINRRFLYNGDEPPKRNRVMKPRAYSGTVSRGPGSKQANSAITLLAASTAKLLTTQKKPKKRHVGHGDSEDDDQRGGKMMRKVSEDEDGLELEEYPGGEPGGGSSDEGVLVIDEERRMRARSSCRREKARQLVNRMERYGRNPMEDRRSRPRHSRPKPRDDSDRPDSALSDTSDFFVQSSAHRSHHGFAHQRRGLNEIPMDMRHSGHPDDDYVCFGSEMVEEDTDEDFSGDLVSPSVLMTGPTSIEQNHSSRRKSPIRPMQVLPVDCNDRNRRAAHVYRNMPYSNQARRRYDSPGSPISPPISNRQLSGLGKLSPDHQVIGGTMILPGVDDLGLPPCSPQGDAAQLSEVDTAFGHVMARGPDRPSGVRSTVAPGGTTSVAPTQSGGPGNPKNKQRAPPGPRCRPSILQRKSMAGNCTPTSASDMISSSQVIPSGTVIISSGEMPTFSHITAISSSDASTTPPVITISRPTIKSGATSTQVLTLAPQTSEGMHVGPQRIKVFTGASLLQATPTTPQTPTASSKLFGRKDEADSKSNFDNSSKTAFFTMSSQTVTSNGGPMMVQNSLPMQYTMVRGAGNGKNFVVLGSGGPPGSGQQTFIRPPIVRTNARSILRTNGGSGPTSSGGITGSLLVVRGSDGSTRMLPTSGISAATAIQPAHLSAFDQALQTPPNTSTTITQHH